jgi:DNA-binding NtrC family response regulator
MLKRRCDESGGDGTARAAPDAVKLLVSMAWPGNLRQLDNIVRRAYALAERSRAGRELVLERSHIERALAYEGGADPSPLISQLWRAARSFVQEAERREGSSAPLPLDLTDAFRGMVLGAAVQRRGSRDEAFALLGQQPMIKNRNHHRALRRELERVRELARTIGGDIDPDLVAMLDAVEDSSDLR